MSQMAEHELPWLDEELAKHTQIEKLSEQRDIGSVTWSWYPRPGNSTITKNCDRNQPLACD